MNNAAAGKKRVRLVRFLSSKTAAHEDRLEAMRAQGEALRQLPNVIWLLLLQSAATMGNSRGWEGLFGGPVLSTLIGFNAVGAIRSDLRLSYMSPILQTAGVRMPRQKAEALALNHDVISELGGEASAREMAFALPTRVAKIAFMKRFHGIGEKYARNVWMDLYDPHFHDTIAYDLRLAKVAAFMGARFQSYLAAEQYFAEIAHQSGRTPWEVDRLLYHFNGEALDAMSATTK